MPTARFQPRPILPAVVLLLAAAFLPAAASGQPDAAATDSTLVPPRDPRGLALLAQLPQRIRDFGPFTARGRCEVRNTVQTHSEVVEAAFTGDGRARCRLTGDSDILLVHDGQTLSWYSRNELAYHTRPAAPGDFRTSDGFIDMIRVDQWAVQALDLAEHEATAGVAFAPAETLTLGGREVACDVLWVGSSLCAFAFWLDPHTALPVQTKLVLGMCSEYIPCSITHTWTEILAGEPPDTVRFTFTPPVGARRLDEEPPDDPSAATGGRAPGPAPDRRH